MSDRPEMSLEKVQHWVVTTIIVAVASFPQGALVGAAHAEYDTSHGNAAVLCVMTGVIGVAAMVAIRLVHRTSPLSPYLLLGLLPAAGSAWWTFSG